MLTLSQKLQDMRVLGLSNGDVQYRGFTNTLRPWRLLIFPPLLDAATLNFMQTAALQCPPRAELMVVVRSVGTLLEPWARMPSSRLVLLADPLERLYRAFGIHARHSHCETFLLNPQGLLQFVLVHRMPGPALMAMVELLALLLRPRNCGHGLATLQ
ncbi:hypothetical protein [Nitrospira sp. Nam74]